MKEKQSQAQFIKMIIDGLSEKDKKELSELISKDFEVPTIKNKIELQVG